MAKKEIDPQALLDAINRAYDDFPDEELRKDYTTLVYAWRPGTHQRRHDTAPALPAVLPLDQAHAIVEQLLRLYTDITRLEEKHYRSFSAHDL